MKTETAITIIKMHLTSVKTWVIDHADNQQLADSLIRQYQDAYGDAFIIYQEN